MLQRLLFGLACRGVYQDTKQLHFHLMSEYEQR
jgi:hypothetical protein